MSAIERVLDALRRNKEGYPGVARVHVSVNSEEFEAALAEAWDGGAKFILEDQQLHDPNDPFMEAALDGRNPWRKS